MSSCQAAFADSQFWIGLFSAAGAVGLVVFAAMQWWLTKKAEATRQKERALDKQAQVEAAYHQQRGIDARVSALANAARNGVEGLRGSLNLIPDPEAHTGTMGHQELEIWLTRLDPLMLRLAEEFPAASEQKARQVRSAIGYFFLAAGELRGALFDRKALLKVRPQCQDRLGLLHTELGNAMAPEMVAGKGTPVATLNPIPHGEGSSGSQKDSSAS